MKVNKVVVIGLDSAAPQLVFNQFLDQLPNIKKLTETGFWGELRSCIPPITIPAWMTMLTGQNPGRLGLNGFRHRRAGTYNDVWIANSTAIKGPAAWDVLERYGKKSCLIAIPPSYPPYKVNGWLVSCFLTPDTSKDFTYPVTLKDEIIEAVGEYLPDVVFRTGDRDQLLEDVYLMTEKRFGLAEHFIKTKDWDFFMMVEIGLDRIQHSFWRYLDPEHHLYEPDSRYKDAILDYYRYLDRRIGAIASLLDDHTALMVTSDHGAKRMKGAFCINDWLIKEGYLTLTSVSAEPVSPEKADIDWAGTKAWGWGGYYSRIYLNVEGREPEGVIPARQYKRVREELAGKLACIPDREGRPMATKVFQPEDIYGDMQPDYPDLMVFFDDLYWRAAGTIGHQSLYLATNDTGPDDAVHGWDGIFIASVPGRQAGKKLDGLRIEDVAPTVLALMGVPVPEDIDGKTIKDVTQ